MVNHLWCKGTGMRNTHVRAIAPTVSNSKLAGNVSAGIEPWAANVFTEQSAKGTFIRKNPVLEGFLDAINRDTKPTWNKILEDGGSVQGLDFLDDHYVQVATNIIVKENLISSKISWSLIILLWATTSPQRRYLKLLRK